MKIKKIGFLFFMLFILLIGCYSLQKEKAPFQASSLTHIYLTFEGNTFVELSKQNAQTTADYLFYSQLIEDFERSEVIDDGSTPQAKPSDTIDVLVKTENQEGLVSLYELFLIQDTDTFTLSRDSKQVNYNVERFQALSRTNSFLSHYQQYNVIEPELTVDGILQSLETSYSLTRKISKNIQFIIESGHNELPSSEVSYDLDLTDKTLLLSNLSALSADDMSLTLMQVDRDQELLIYEEALLDSTIQLPQQNGQYHLTLTQDVKNANVSGSIISHLYFSITHPTVFSIQNDYLEPGDLLVLKAEHFDPEANYQINLDLYYDGSGFVPYQESYLALIPLTSKTTAGEYTLYISNTKDENIIELPFTVHPKEFPIQELTTSSTTASIQNENNYALMEEAFERGRKDLHQDPLWDGPFLQPAEGRISTEYGVIRYTNGSESSSRHSGIDFANPLGTPTYATQNGYITLSEMINVTGNTVFIDHGFQIVSQYYHLDTMAVEVGDYVKKGDLIGTIGSTGFSTGPHLHFSIYSHGVYVNPWKFFDQAPF